MPIADSVPDANKGERLHHPGHESGCLYTACSAHIQNLIFLRSDLIFFSHTGLGWFSHTAE